MVASGRRGGGRGTTVQRASRFSFTRRPAVWRQGTGMAAGMNMLPPLSRMLASAWAPENVHVKRSPIFRISEDASLST